MPDELKMVCAEAGSHTVILRLEGHLDAKGAPVLMERAQTLRAGGCRLILNLAGVTFIASSGIGALLALVEDAAEERQPVCFAALSAEVRSVIDLLNLDQFLTIYPGEAEALAARAA